MSDKNKEICACTDDEVVLIFACSGGADVGQLSDVAARQMMADCWGKMFCLAGVGGNVEGILKTTRDADKILHFQVTALGFEKGKAKIEDRAISKIVDHGKGMIC